MAQLLVSTCLRRTCKATRQSRVEYCITFIQTFTDYYVFRQFIKAQTIMLCLCELLIG